MVLCVSAIVPVTLPDKQTDNTDVKTTIPAHQISSTQSVRATRKNWEYCMDQHLTGFC